MDGARFRGGGGGEGESIFFPFRGEGLFKKLWLYKAKKNDFSPFGAGGREEAIALIALTRPPPMHRCSGAAAMHFKYSSAKNTKIKIPL